MRIFGSHSDNIGGWAATADEVRTRVVAEQLQKLDDLRFERRTSSGQVEFAFQNSDGDIVGRIVVLSYPDRKWNLAGFEVCSGLQMQGSQTVEELGTVPPPADNPAPDSSEPVIDD